MAIGSKLEIEWIEREDLFLDILNQYRKWVTCTHMTIFDGTFS